MANARFPGAALIALAASLMLAGCGDKAKESASAGGQKLAPIPEAPQIKVERQALPGADGALAVVVARPTGTVRGEVRPTITFSKPVVALQAVESEASLPAVAEISPALPGKWSWLGSASVEFVPEGLVPYSTEFQITVRPGLEALDGTRLAAPYSFEFQTPSPVVQGIEPANQFAWLAPDQIFTVLMNQPVKDLAAHARLLVGPGKEPVALQVVKETSLAEERRAKEGERDFARQPFEERGFMNRQTRYELKAATALPLDSEIVLVIDAELPGADGPLTLGSEVRYTFRTYGPMKLIGAQGCMYGWEGAQCPYGPLVLITSNKADPKSLQGKVSVEPPVEIDWDRVESFLPEPWSNLKQPYVSLPGKYRPGTRYTIKVAAGATDEWGQRAGALSEQVRLDDLTPSFSLGQPLALLEATRDGVLPVESVNLSRGEAQVWALTPAQLAAQLAWEPWHDRALEPIPEQPPTDLTLDLSGTRNTLKSTPLPLRDALPPGQRTGLFLVKASSPDLPTEVRSQERVIAQITDLAVHAKLGTRSGALWVTSLSKGKPVQGAALRLLDKSGAVRWEGVSDANGLARTPGLSELVPERGDTWSTPFALAVAEKDGDIGATLSSWSDGLSPASFGLPTDWDDKQPRSLGLVFADRGIYRPGDEVFLKGLARIRRLGDLQRPDPGAQVTVKVISSRDTEVHKQVVKVSPFGTFSSKFTLGKDLPLGHYQVTAELKAHGQTLTYGGGFRVEEYRAPQFRVDLSVPASNAVAGEPLSATVSARYLFGGALSRAAAQWSVARSSIDFAPPGNEGFAFGTQTWWWDDEQPQPTREVFGGGNGETDAQGALALSLGQAEAPGGKTWEYTVEAEVTDVNRQRVANRARITVHPAEVYAGVRLTSEGFVEAGKPVNVELIAADPAGARREGLDVGLEVKRREWKSIRKKGVGNQWFTTSEPVETRVAGCQVKSLATAAGCELTLAEPGLHILEAAVTDSRGRKQVTRTSVYVIGSGWVSWQRNDTDRIDLVADKPLYGLGETAKILVKSPYPEAEALLTVEREGVFSARRVKLTGAASTLEIPIDESLVPNAFVGVVLVRGRVATDLGIETGEDPGRPAVRVGYVQLRIEDRSKRLAVDVKPDAAEKRPGEKVSVSLKVNDWKGRGVRGEVTVWAVDEGVLRLTDYQVPDPVAAIHPPRGLSVRIGEPLLHLVLARLYGEKGATPGGSGGNDASGSGFRSNFKTTVLFQDVVTDEQGVGRVEFELPDNLTTFRIMALATDATDLFGAGQSSVAVSKPLLALPALPRLARAGDRFEAGVVVHTHGTRLDEVKVTAQAEGLKLSGPAEKTISMADGAPKEVRFDFVAEQPGTARLRFALTSGAERDGLEQKLPVIVPVSTEAVATYGDTTDERVEAVARPGGMRPGVGGLQVTMTSTVLGNFDEGMRQLVEYPYGCLEQLSSKLVPFIALRELHGLFQVGYQAEPAAAQSYPDFIARWLGEPTLDLAGVSDPDEVVRRTVKAIEQLQNSDGGYRYWPSGVCSDSYASAYAVLALGRARDAGYPVDAAGLKKAQTFLADTVAAGRCIDCGWGCAAPDDATRVFALYSLARIGAPRSSYYGEQFARREKLPLFAQAMLADAMFVGGGDRGQADQLLKELLNSARESAGKVHFEESDPRTYAARWSSDTRTTAIVLQTLADIAPDHPYVAKISNYLTTARQRDGRFRNTQEAAFGLMALTEVVRIKEKQVPDFTARVRLGDTELASERFKGRTMDARQVLLPIEKLASFKGSPPLVFERDGAAGVLYYSALLRYAPEQLPTEPLDRGMVVQRWFEPYQGGGQARSFRAGDLVRVRVRLGSHMERSHVVLEVPLPAGLETVDTTLASSAQQPSAPRGEGPGEGYEYESAEDFEPSPLPPSSPFATRFYSPFNHTEVRDDQVVLFADRLPPGVHVASFVARATTPGDFVLRPAKAEEMYSPEVFGRSDGGRFEVTLPAPVAER